MMSQANLKELLLALSFEPTSQNNINATKMRHIKVPVPPLSEQQCFVAATERVEQAIAAAQAVIAAAPAKKQAIMQAYLS